MVYWSEGHLIRLAAFFGLMGQMPHWAFWGTKNLPVVLE
jgi:hypothetical protein